MLLADILRNAAIRLAPDSPTARLDAELLMAHALGLSREDMLLRMRDLAVPSSFPALVERRAAHEPVAYITGRQDFWDLTLKITPDVLIPRADSETLIEAAAVHFADIAPPARILDLGTGSGALLLAALSLFPGANGAGIDASGAALAVAKDNAGACGFEGRTRFHVADWSERGWAECFAAPFDLILCNPPYVETAADLPASVARYEPGQALFSGEDGLDDYRILMPQLAGLLADGGIAILEIGATQERAVAARARSAGFTALTHRDLAGKPRALRLLRNA